MKSKRYTAAQQLKLIMCRVRERLGNARLHLTAGGKWEIVSDRPGMRYATPVSGEFSNSDEAWYDAALHLGMGRPVQGKSPAGSTPVRSTNQTEENNGTNQDKGKDREDV